MLLIGLYSMLPLRGSNYKSNIKNHTYSIYNNNLYIFRHSRISNIRIIHHYIFYQKDMNDGLTIVARVLTKHPIIWNKYRTNYKIIRKIKGYYVLEHIEQLHFETINAIYAAKQKIINDLKIV